MDCLFCKIIAGEIPSSKVYEDEYCYAFLDVAPQAPVHCLLVPKTHIASMDEVCEDNRELVSHLFAAVPTVAKLLSLGDGYRIISNVGENGCQSVKHLHIHILGGKKLSENMA